MTAINRAVAVFTRMLRTVRHVAFNLRRTLRENDLCSAESVNGNIRFSGRFHAVCNFSRNTSERSDIVETETLQRKQTFRGSYKGRKHASRHFEFVLFRCIDFLLSHPPTRSNKRSLRLALKVRGRLRVFFRRKPSVICIGDVPSFCTKTKNTFVRAGVPLFRCGGLTRSLLTFILFGGMHDLC